MARVIEIPYKPRPVQVEIHQGMESHRFSVIVAHRRLGKTVAVINHMIKAALTYKLERARYAYIAPFRRQAKDIAWDYFKHYGAPIPGIRHNESELMIEMPNGAKINLFGADNPDSLRGLYWDGVIMDEVSQMRREIWGEIVRPAIADRKGWVIWIGTPKGINLFSELYDHGLSDPDWYADLFTPERSGVIDNDELELARKTMSDAQFRQEFLCDFSASSDNTLIPWDLVLESAGKTLHPTMYAHAPVVIGVDVARFGDDKSVILVRQGLAILDIQKIHLNDVMTLASAVAYEVVKRKPDALFVDEVGIGAGVVDRLRQLGHDVYPVNAGRTATKDAYYANKRAEMWDAIREWLEAGGSIPDDPELKEDLVSPLYSFDPAGRMRLEPKEKLKERIARSPDCGDALALTFAETILHGRRDDRTAGSYKSYRPQQTMSAYDMFKHNRSKRNA